MKGMEVVKGFPIHSSHSVFGQLQTEHWSLGMSVTSLVIVPLQLVNGQAKRGGTHSLELEAAQILVNCSPSHTLGILI